MAHPPPARESGKSTRTTLEATCSTPSICRPTGKQGTNYPVIVEYAGNRYQTSPGTVDGSNLGYGISGGKGAIWVCLPFVDVRIARMPQAGGVTSRRPWTTARTPSDASAPSTAATRQPSSSPVSAGAIACNYIGLHDDEIASLWRGFICHSHYDGVREWPYAGSDRNAAAERLKRLGNRPQFISHENNVNATKNYLMEVSRPAILLFWRCPSRITQIPGCCGIFRKGMQFVSGFVMS